MRGWVREVNYSNGRRDEISEGKGRRGGGKRIG